MRVEATAPSRVIRLVAPRRQQLTVLSPCPVDPESLDIRGGVCASCSHEVVDLSALTDRQAKARVRAAGGKPFCAEFRYDARGQIELARPRRVAANLAVNLAAAVGLALAVSGCTARVNSRVPAAPVTESTPGCEVRPTAQPLTAQDASTLAPDVDPSLVTVVNFSVAPNNDFFRGMVVSHAEAPLLERRAKRLTFTPTAALVGDAQQRRRERARQRRARRQR